MAEQIMPETDSDQAVSLSSVAKKRKLLSRVAWGLRCPYTGRKAGSVLEAVRELQRLGFSEEQILAETVGAGAGVNLIEEITHTPEE